MTNIYCVLCIWTKDHVDTTEKVVQYYDIITVDLFDNKDECNDETKLSTGCAICLVFDSYSEAHDVAVLLK